MFDLSHLFETQHGKDAACMAAVSILAWAAMLLSVPGWLSGKLHMTPRLWLAWLSAVAAMLGLSGAAIYFVGIKSAAPLIAMAFVGGLMIVGAVYAFQRHARRVLESGRPWDPAN